MTTYELILQPDWDESCFPTEDLMLCALSDHTFNLRETRSGEVRRKLKGHAGQIYKCLFFPSGVAGLTAGADMQLKVWCLKTGKCVATLAPKLAGCVSGFGENEPGGHRAGILDVGIIERGRNVVAIDRLGWLRLWDVSTQICISAIPVTESSSNQRHLSMALEEVTCLALKKHWDPTVLETCTSEPWYKNLETSSSQVTEVGTTDTLVAVGTGVGARTRLYELGARHKGCVAQCILPSATGSVEAVSFVENKSHLNSSAFDEYGLFTGGQSGELVSWDIRNTNEPLWRHTRDGCAVDHLRVYRYPNDPYYCLFVGRSDGRVTIYPYDPKIFQDQLISTSLELTGINCEPIKGLVGGPLSKSVWTISYGGTARHYHYIETHQAFAQK